MSYHRGSCGCCEIGPAPRPIKFTRVLEDNRSCFWSDQDFSPEVTGRRYLVRREETESTASNKSFASNGKLLSEESGNLDSSFVRRWEWDPFVASQFVSGCSLEETYSEGPSGSGQGKSYLYNPYKESAPRVVSSEFTETYFYEPNHVLRVTRTTTSYQYGYDSDDNLVLESTTTNTVIGPNPQVNFTASQKVSTVADGVTLTETYVRTTNDDDRTRIERLTMEDEVTLSDLVDSLNVRLDWQENQGLGEKNRVSRISELTDNFFSLIYKRGKYAWGVPPSHEGSYYGVRWTERFFPADYDPAQPNLHPPIDTERTWEWSGAPGGPADPSDFTGRMSEIYIGDTPAPGWAEIAKVEIRHISSYPWEDVSSAAFTGKLLPVD